MSEKAWLTAIFVVYLVLNLLTADRSPTVWTDEVMFTDPAANAALGRGLVSTSWATQTSKETWVGNSPLHTWLLAPWIKAWGLSPAAVRSINFVYMIAAALCVWLFAKRSGLVHSPALRVLLIVVILCAYGVAFSYRSGRYDAIGILLLCAVAAAATVVKPLPRFASMFALSALIPIAGLQLLPFLCVLAPATLLGTGKRYWKEVAIVAIGSGTGLALFLGSYWAAGLLDAYLAAIRRVSPAQVDFSSRVAYVIRNSVVAVTGDRSAPLVGVGFLFAIAAAIRVRSRGALKASAIGLLFVVAVPVAFLVAGRYPIYYTWMPFVPAAILLAAALSETLSQPRSRAIALLGATAFALAAFGLPARLATVFLEWEPRDYARVEAFATAALRSDDHAFVDFGAYYPARRKAAEMYTPVYVPAFLESERAALTVAIIDPENAEARLAELGGAWKDTGQELSNEASNSFVQRLGINTAKPYRLRVYRRAEP